MLRQAARAFAYTAVFLLVTFAAYADAWNKKTILKVYETIQVPGAVLETVEREFPRTQVLGGIMDAASSKGGEKQLRRCHSLVSATLFNRLITDNCVTA